MRKRSAFRPLVMDALEVRVVLSATANAAAKHHAPLTPQAVATDRLMIAYNNFINNFTNSFMNNIDTPESNGSESDLTEFSKELTLELKALANGAAKALGSETADATVITNVRQTINGPDSTSLRNRLASVTVAGLNNGTVLTSYMSTATTVIQQNYTAVKQDIVAATSSSSTPSS